MLQIYRCFSNYQKLFETRMRIELMFHVLQTCAGTNISYLVIYHREAVRVVMSGYDPVLQIFSLLLLPS